MALTTDQKASKLFKKWIGVGETSTARDFFEEPYLGRPVVFPSQVWNQQDQIPTHAAVVPSITELHTDLVLTAVPGTTNSFFSVGLIDAIPFDYGDGSYNYVIKDNTGARIDFGRGDWVVDPDAGVLTFYGTVPSNMPPKITFYKYTGTKGVGGGGTGDWGHLKFINSSQDIHIKPYYQYFIYGDLEVEGVIRNEGEVVIMNGALKERGDGHFNNINGGVLRFVIVPTGIDGGGDSGHWNFIPKNITVNVKKNHQYLIYDDLTIEGVLNNEGEVTILNGNLIEQYGGRLNNIDGGILRLVDLGGGEGNVIKETILFNAIANTPLQLTHHLSTEDLNWTAYVGDNIFVPGFRVVDANTVEIITLTNISGRIVLLG